MAEEIVVEGADDGVGEDHAMMMMEDDIGRDYPGLDDAAEAKLIGRTLEDILKIKGEEEEEEEKRAKSAAEAAPLPAAEAKEALTELLMARPALRVLGDRLASLKAASAKWASGDVSAAIREVAASASSSAAPPTDAARFAVVADFLRAVELRQEALRLNDALELLPVLDAMLATGASHAQAAAALDAAALALKDAKASARESGRWDDAVGFKAFPDVERRLASLEAARAALTESHLERCALKLAPRSLASFNWFFGQPLHDARNAPKLGFLINALLKNGHVEAAGDVFRLAAGCGDRAAGVLASVGQRPLAQLQETLELLGEDARAQEVAAARAEADVDLAP